VTVKVVVNVGVPDGWANDADSCPFSGDIEDVKVTDCGEPETNGTVT
jgi:hypothetical protein